MIRSRWQEKNNRLLFSLTGIDNQGLLKVIKEGKKIKYLTNYNWIKLSSNHWALSLDTPKSKLSKLKSKWDDDVPGIPDEAVPMVVIEVEEADILVGGGVRRMHVEEPPLL